MHLFRRSNSQFILLILKRINENTLGHYTYTQLGCYLIFIPPNFDITQNIHQPTSHTRKPCPNKQQRPHHSDSQVERNPRGRQPRPPSNKILHRKLRRLSRTRHHTVTTPLHSPASRTPRPKVPILSIIQRPQRKFTVPLQPPLRVHQLANVTPQEHRPRILLPRPSQKRLKITQHRDKVRTSHDARVVYYNSRGLVRVCSSLRCYCVFLLGEGFSGVDHAVLEHRCGVAEDEVDGAVDVALFVELALGVGVESVLVALEAAAVEDGEVGAGAQRHRLVVLWAGGVAECDAAGDESVSLRRCKMMGVWILLAIASASS